MRSEFEHGSAPMLIFFSPQSQVHSFDIEFQQRRTNRTIGSTLHDVLRRHLHPHVVEIANETKIYTASCYAPKLYVHQVPVFLVQNQAASSTCRFYITATTLLTL